MKRFDSFSGFQVLGHVLFSFHSGLGPSWKLASRLMIEEGLGTMGPEGWVQFEPEQWYPLPGNLRALARIQRDLGEVAIRQMATQVPRVAKRPAPYSVDVRTALEQVNVAYHVNHARDGQPMYSEKTGEMLEGIGHYRALPGASAQQVLVECTNPYPCVFDQSLLLSFAQQINPSSTLVHLEPESCRARGAVRCTYGVSWT